EVGGAGGGGGGGGGGVGGGGGAGGEGGGGGGGGGAGGGLRVEGLDLSPRARRAPGLIGPAKAISTVIAAGWRPEGNPEDPNRLDLAGPGALYRALANGAHATENIVKPVFTHSHNEILQTRRQN